MSGCAARQIGRDVSIVPHKPTHVATLALKAERARVLFEIHDALCRWKRQGVRCSTCDELGGRAARLARAAGEHLAVRAS